MNSNNNLNLKKNTKPIDRKIYAKYLIDKRKSEKILRKNNIVKFINDTTNDINCINKDLINNIDSISEYNNEELNIKNIIIGNNIHIDVKNVKNIKISTNNDEIKIELDKTNNKNKVINEMDQLSRNIKELDTLLNLLDIFLTLVK
jgi:uncharacterized protein